MSEETSLKRTINQSVKDCLHRLQYLSPADRWSYMYEHLEWLVSDFDELEVDWLKHGEKIEGI
tara:strand:- start:137 stop:325 length:189 start_codon:yes stop_codon:yes gene_type:complete